MTGNDDIRRERQRRDEEIVTLAKPHGYDSAAKAGVVVTATTSAGNYLKWQPQAVFGTETEGAPGVLTTQSTNLEALFLGPGTASGGESLVFRHVDYRWVCERGGYGSSTIALPGCACLVPRNLTMSVTNPGLNDGIFQAGTLSWQAVPAALSLLYLGPYAYLSNSTFVDPSTGDTFWYLFYCTTGLWALSRVFQYSIFGSPYREGIRYRWFPGLPGNQCSPFLLSNGQVYSGGDPGTVVTLSA